MRSLFERFAAAAAVILVAQAAAHADYIKVHEQRGRKPSVTPGAAGAPAATASAAADAAAPAPAAAGAPPRIIYLNRKGGVFTSSDHDDSTMNLSGALHFANPGITEHVSSWNAPDPVFEETLRCSQAMWGRFNVRVTDVDPGSTPHIEAVLTSSKNTDLGFDASTGGIALLDCDVPVIENAVVWIFPEASGNKAQRTCEVVAQEVGHAMQLDHELLCKDPMTYLDGCENRSFQDVDALCHDSHLPPRVAPCACSGNAMQNSVQSLLTRLGPGETEPPTVEITSPGEGAGVKPGFQLAAVASDNYVVVQAEVWVDDRLVATLLSLGGGWAAPRTLATGAHKVEVKVYDPAGNVGSAVVNVNIEPECQGDADCGASRLCTAGVCFGDLGAACSAGQDCASDQCSFDASNVQLCTKTCATGGDCPSGFSCDRVGVSPVLHCLPSGDSGGCALGQAGRSTREQVPLGFALLTILGLLTLRPRRRR